MNATAAKLNPKRRHFVFIVFLTPRRSSARIQSPANDGRMLFPQEGTCQLSQAAKEAWTAPTPKLLMTSMTRQPRSLNFVSTIGWAGVVSKELGSVLLVSLL